MEKKARTNYPINDLIVRRWSPRAFSPKVPGKEIVLSLFEAARWAPSCFNEQPWSFIFACREDPEEFQAMLDCLVPGNARWAVNAPILIVAVAAEKFASGRNNRWAWHDVGMAVENLLLEATSKGLFAHPMAGFDQEKVRATYGIPEDHSPVLAIALGYPGEVSDLPEELQDAESAQRDRKPIYEFTFRRTWGDNRGV
ncbi:nitroreductase family protein [Dethiosulfovibrio salsuginis]|uniref:Nitroreductase n=1 Tax=Dethiosulfovibrio salsuginis TaxID=561720 RepID=A0A1X7L640_9BACT|nr:nitroreductase family protein [Dethiosulfovibrio salsuginis]SMG48579.1 Nitroreductase [Dethiosulfovibrio salsuginis]